MASEIIDIYNSRGEQIDTLDKDIAHKNGLWHKSIHVWIINSEGNILLQKRCKDKTLYPNTWDCSFAGHISTKETSIDAVIREGKEELGIDISLDNLELILTNREKLEYNDIKSNEFVDIYILKQDVLIDDIILQQEEVSEAKYVSIIEFNDLIKNNKIFPHKIEYIVLNEYLKSS